MGLLVATAVFFALGGCGQSIYLAAGDGARARGDFHGALQSYASARKWDRKSMSKAERKRLMAATATGARGVLKPMILSACDDAKSGAPALSKLLEIYFADNGIVGELSTEERSAVRRQSLACISKAMRAALGYDGLAPTKYREIVEFVGRVANLRAQLRLPATANPAASDPSHPLAMALRQVATPGLLGMWGVCDALVDAGRPFEALEIGTVTHVTTGRDKPRLEALRDRVELLLIGRADAAKTYPDVRQMFAALAATVRSAPTAKGTSKVPHREPIAWQLGRVTMNRCPGEVVQNFGWRVKANSFSPIVATVDLHLERCHGEEQWKVEHRTARIARKTERKATYVHTFEDFTTTYACELTNTVKSRKCTVDARGSATELACKTETTLEKVCSPTAHPLETTKPVTKRWTSVRTRKIRRRVHVGTWHYSVSGHATVRWADRQIQIPVDVQVKRAGEWWNDSYGAQAKPDWTLTKIRQLTVDKAVLVIRKAAVSVLANDALAATSAARIASHHKDEVAWANHALRAARLGLPQDRDAVDRLARFIGVPHGRYRLKLVAPGRPVQHIVKRGYVRAELRGGDVRVDPTGRRFAMPAPRRDHLVENLRAIVQGPIVMPKQKDSHFEAVGWLGPSPLDPRRMVPRYLAKARLNGWFGVGFGGDLEALGQGTRGWTAELSLGPVLSDDFALVELFGRVRQHRLLPRADDLGLPEGPSSLDNLDLGLRASTGGPLGVYVDAAFNAGGITDQVDAMRSHPIGLGAIIDLRVITLQAGVTYWWGEQSVLSWQGGLGLRL